MTATAATDVETLFDQLASWDGKAEIVDGEIVPMSPTGPWPGHAGDEIYASLRAYVKKTKKSVAVSDNKIFRVRNLPRRQSFSPDAAYFTGPKQAMRYYDGAPDFAVEVRGAGDYGSNAEAEPAVPGWTMAVNDLLPEDWRPGLEPAPEGDSDVN